MIDGLNGRLDKRYWLGSMMLGSTRLEKELWIFTSWERVQIVLILAF